MLTRLTAAAWQAGALSGLMFAATPAAAEGGLNVIATIKPVHALAAQVMEGVAEPALLVSGSASPHTFALKPSDARKLQEAVLLFRVSEAVEPFTRRLAAQLPASAHVVTLAEAEGVRRLPRRTGALFDEHEPHAGEPKEGHHDGDDAVDGHVWLDPQNAKAMVSQIAKSLSAADPSHAQTFAANAQKAIQRLDALEGELRSRLEPVRSRPFAVFHDAYQYFERRFGLEAVGAITLSPEIQPSARRLSEVRERIKSAGAVCVFAEPNFSPRLVSTAVEGTSARTAVLDPAGAGVEPGADAYDTLMRSLAASIHKCLSQ